MISMNNKFNLVIMVTQKDLGILSISVPYIKKYITPQKIICVSQKSNEDKIRQLECVFEDEDNVFPGMDYQAISNLIKGRGGNVQRTGWYFQQFLKMAYSFKCQTEYYVVWDADTIPLNNISYIKSGRYLLMTKKEYHLPYFKTIRILFNGNITRYRDDISFIAENMPIDKKMMIGLIQKIESNASIEGKLFYEKIIYAIDKENLSKSGFSEFETYGNYVMATNASSCELIKRKSLRIGSYICGYKPSKGQLDWLSTYYDIVSIENKTNSLIHRVWATWFSLFTNIKLFRKIVSPHNAAVFGMKMMRIQERLRGRNLTIDYDID